VRDLKNPGWIIAKGFLFLFLGLLSGGLLLFEHPSLKTLLLIAVMVWSFCRFYYFGFYVLGRYVDPNYRFSGLISMLRYVVSRRKVQIEARQEGKI
jgi:hypothetical protein